MIDLETPVEKAFLVAVDTGSEDGWTARTKDGSLSAHFEYSVAVTEAGPRVLGLLPGDARPW